MLYLKLRLYRDVFQGVYKIINDKNIVDYLAQKSTKCDVL